MTSHDVTLEWPDGRTRTLAVDEDETILKAAECDRAVLPYGCRTGACGTCAGRLLEVEGRQPSDGECNGDGAVDASAVDDAVAYCRLSRALKDRHRAAGYVLLCIASPRADCRIAVGSSVHTELVDNPWK
ncbi:2Fe-2S iron-sulfur cluster-binding protein [Natrinema thermotolerans]|uniref:2Fe-2S iron-sulfur cluster-binding protein n=1 Tax=Natrinema thermotolerans TaxID=121872 RepID=A0AAF0PBD1_9EURY|nr:2Fe-2S iron-sulfur cluster-binding protein [Natrinema thermotolerans]QCC59001.1 ferredoxin [Natrinema thermotolerans]WMT05945.1 2Fe-2S iron-sulfur cluster-binding protein [Natrinema thermotolerans]